MELTDTAIGTVNRNVLRGDFIPRDTNTASHRGTGTFSKGAAGVWATLRMI